MNVTVTLQFANAAEAAEALSKLSGVIAPVDRPDIGTTVALPSFPTLDVGQVEQDARAVFGGAVAAATPPFAGVPVVPTVPVIPAVDAPTPPSVVIAPIVAPGSLELDAEGIPWDSRIHTEARSKNKDGTWRAKRGINDEVLVKRIKAELLAAVAGAPAAPTADPTPTVLVPPIPTVPVTPIAAATGVPVPPSTTAPSPAAAAAPQTPKAYHEVVMMVNVALSEGKITDAQVVAMLAGFPGVTGIPALATRPDLWTQVYYMFAAVLGVV